MPLLYVVIIITGCEGISTEGWEEDTMVLEV